MILVVISIWIVLFFNVFSVLVCVFWFLLLWIVVLWIFVLDSFLIILLVLCLVCVNISVCLVLFCFNNVINVGIFCCLFIVISFCLIILMVEFCGVIDNFIGLLVMDLVNVIMFGVKVVENNKVWCLVGISFKMCLMLWIKFIFSMVLVLFNIRIFSFFSVIVFCWYKFSKCLGVVINIFVFFCSVIICGLIFILLNIMVFLICKLVL